MKTSNALILGILWTLIFKMVRKNKGPDIFDETLNHK